MEPALQSKKSRRKKKKRKSSKKNDDQTIVKPECLDGMSNWLNLQKTLEKPKERVPENLKGDKDKSFKRPFKRRRLMHSDKTLQKKQEKMDIHSESYEKDGNDSGCVSGSELSPEDSNNNSNLNGNSTKNHTDYVSDDESLKDLTKVLSIDCEMVGTGPDGKDSILARVSIVNAYGQCVYDEFVKPKEKVTDYRTQISGVRPSDLKKGKDLFEVQKDVATMIEGRRLVGHDLKHDFNVLFLSHPRSLIRDTSKYKPFREVSGGKTPSLRKLTSMILGCNIQSGEHSSVEDAQAAMLLYLRHKKDWERQIKAQRKRKPMQ